jgi:hypothetical protein
VDDHYEVDQLLSRCLHAVNSEDGDTATKLFSPDATVEIFTRDQGTYRLVDEVMGKELIGYVVKHLLHFQQVAGAARRISTDHLVEIDGDSASVSANFFVMAAADAATGAHSGLASPPPVLEIVQAGLFKVKLAKFLGEWKITNFRVYNDFPAKPLDEENKSLLAKSTTVGAEKS